MLNDIMLNIIMLNVMLSVVILSVVRLSVVGPQTETMRSDSICWTKNLPGYFFEKVTFL
jgi:hypothetical protein